jgi:aryl-alcohol dehydrogenase-like predicted oxidoreductase
MKIAIGSYRRKQAAAQSGWTIFVPIPGTKRRERLAENAAALSVALSPAELARIEAAVPSASVSGLRYPAETMKSVNR